MGGALPPSYDASRECISPPEPLGLGPTPGGLRTPSPGDRTGHGPSRGDPPPRMAPLDLGEWSAGRTRFTELLPVISDFLGITLVEY